MSERSVAIPPLQKAPERRLDSWKEIAAYLNRDVTTVQRWEKREGMPVHRHVHASRGSVYALADELDVWIESRRVRENEAEAAPSPEAIAAPEQGRPAGSHRYLWLTAVGLVSVGLAAVAWLGLRDRRIPASPPAIRSLAVLPLKNLSGDPSQEYLAEGMTEALIGRLSAIHNLRVISHTSVMRFRDPQVSAPEIARILGVDALVEGSVIRDGSRIRITAQLIRGATDEHFWSATYDREMRDALTMQSELAESIAEKVEVTVTGDEHRRFTATRPVAPEVYESYLKGRYAQTNGTAQQSAADFEDAIHQDATFAPAYLGLAEVWSGLGTVAGGVSPAEARPKVIGFARQALALDPDLVDAHVILANVLQEEWHWAEAETEYRRALDLNPNAPEARAGFALWLLCEGRTDEAVAWIQSARKLDPTEITGHDVSWILFQAHHNDEAIRESRSAVALQPDDVGALSALGFELAATDKSAEAIPNLERAVALSHGNFASTGVLIRAYARAGRRRDALALLAQLQARRKSGYVPAAAFINAYLGLGDREQAFYWLEQAYNEKSNILQYVRTHPYFDPIRSDPRFADLIRRVGLG